jgi:hypothetical protein
MERAAAVRQSNLKGCMLKVHLKITKLLPCFLKCSRQRQDSMKGPLMFDMNKLSNDKLNAVLLYQYGQPYIVTLPFLKVTWYFCMEIKLSVPRQTLMSTEISTQYLQTVGSLALLNRIQCVILEKFVWLFGINKGESIFKEMIPKFFY